MNCSAWNWCGYAQTFAPGNTAQARKPQGADEESTSMLKHPKPDLNLALSVQIKVKIISDSSTATDMWGAL